MTQEKHHLPSYKDLMQSIAILALDRSGSNLHGMMCGYLCAGADKQGAAYLQHLLGHKKEESVREAVLFLFKVYSISQQQIAEFNFEFEMLLPDDDAPLGVRAQAFSEWCKGFCQSLSAAGVEADQFDDEDSQEAFYHLQEFAELDYQALEVNEEDEHALMEVSEYARMAVIRLHSDLIKDEGTFDGSNTAH